MLKGLQRIFAEFTKKKNRSMTQVSNVWPVFFVCTAIGKKCGFQCRSKINNDINLLLEYN